MSQKLPKKYSYQVQQACGSTKEDIYNIRYLIDYDSTKVSDVLECLVEMMDVAR
jgi:hypothetical protein